MSHNNWYVYIHIRKDKNEVFYVGIGNKKNYGRAFEFRKDKRNQIWWKVYCKTEIDVKIIHDNLSKIESSNKETDLIKKYGRKDLSEGTLTNMTDGGDGIWNCIMSENTKEKMRQSKLGDKNPNFGKSPSKETTLKRSKSLTGQKRSEETKKKQSISSIKSGQAKEVDVFKFSTNEFIGRFHSISEACRFLGFHHLNGKAVMVANGKRNQTQGYVFSYTN